MNVQKVVAVIKEPMHMVNPFKLAWKDDEPAPFLNIATGVVMPPQTTDQLLFAKQTWLAEEDHQSVLLAELEGVSFGVGRLPSNKLEAALMFNEMALLQSLMSAGCTTSGNLAQKQFAEVTAALSQENCSRIDVVFNR
ncbi:hypothetical protein ACROYT_G026127 [Oculina patagonica]